MFFANKTVFSLDTNGEVAAQEIPMPDLPQTDYGAAFAKMILTLFALVILLYVSYWFLKKLIQGRLQRGPAHAAIKVLEKRMLSPKSMLYLVEVEGQKVLLAESHLEIRRLQSWTETGQIREEDILAVQETQMH